MRIFWAYAECFGWSEIASEHFEHGIHYVHRRAVNPFLPFSDSVEELPEMYEPWKPPTTPSPQVHRNEHPFLSSSTTRTGTAPGYLDGAVARRHPSDPRDLPKRSPTDYMYNPAGFRVGAHLSATDPLTISAAYASHAKPERRSGLLRSPRTGVASGVHHPESIWVSPIMHPDGDAPEMNVPVRFR